VVGSAADSAAAGSVVDSAVDSAAAGSVVDSAVDSAAGSASPLPSRERTALARK